MFDKRDQMLNSSLECNARKLKRLFSKGPFSSLNSMEPTGTNESLIAQQCVQKARLFPVIETESLVNLMIFILVLYS